MDKLVSKLALTGIATAIGPFSMLFASIILSKYIKPADFGVFGVFVAWVYLFGSISALRYDNSYFSMNSQNDREHIFWTVVILSIGFVIFLYMISGIFSFFPIEKSFRYQALSIYIKYTPQILLSSLFYTQFNSMGNYFLSYSNIKYTSYLKIVQGAVFSVLSVIFLRIFEHEQVLLYAYLISFAVPIVFFGNFFLPFLKQMNLKHFRFTLKKYREYAYFSSPATFISVFMTQIPLFVASTIFTPDKLGNFSFAQRLFSAPISLISTSVSQIFIGRLRESVQETNKVKYDQLFSEILKIQIVFAILVVIPLSVFSNFWILKLFGAKWSLAATFIQVLSIGAIFESISKPFGVLIDIFQRQDLHLRREFLRLCIVSSFSLSLLAYSPSDLYAIFIFSFSNAISFSVYFYFSAGLKVKGHE